MDKSESQEATVVENASVEDNSPVEKAPVEDSSVVEKAPAEATPEKTWRDELSEELKGEKALANYESVDAMAKSLLNAQKLVGKKVSDMSAEDLIKVNAKFGVPSDPNNYDFEASDEFKAHAHELGLNHQQAAKLYETSVKAAQAAEEANLEALEAHNKGAVEALEAEFGGKMEARVDLAKKAARELGGEDLESTIFNSQIGLDPKLIKAFSEAGKRLFDHESVQEGTVSSALTLDDINTEMKELYSAENRKILADPTHSKNKSISDRILQLSELRVKLQGKA
jgi:hypothetical protein